MTTSDAGDKVQAYLKSIEERLHKVEYYDSEKNIIREFRQAERNAIADAMMQIIATLGGGGTLRVALTLSPEARKEVVVYLGLLPLFASDAEAASRQIVILTPDGNSEARWVNRSRSLSVLEPKLEFACWYQLEPLPEYGNRRRSLDGMWIIGELDSTQPPVGGHLAAAKAAVQRVIDSPGCPAVLIHQEGQASIVPIPQTLASRRAAAPGAPQPAAPKGGCFIATAACGSGDAPDVAALRAWRDRVLSRSALGRSLIRSYAAMSPPVARWIEPRSWARRFVRAFVVAPAVRLVGRRI